MSRELPRALRPWSEALSVFPHDVAVTVGRWLPRLDAVIGPLRTRPQSDGEPDGFDGLTRRGTYERLLATEWLLADELPDEFLRRAAAREHAFYALARQSPARSPRCTVVFDAGWEQLGAPRLAHIALLVVFARRALAARAELAWGVARAPGVLERELSARAVEELVASRGADELTPSAFQQWLAAVEPDADDDLWFVGGPATARLATAGGASHVLIEEPVELGSRQLNVTARAARRADRSASLDLPPIDDAVRVLRDPFDAKRAAESGGAREIDDAAGFVILPRSRRVVARSRDGEVLALHVPNSTAERAGRTRRHRLEFGATLAGVGFDRRHLVVATSAGPILSLHGVRRGRPLELSPERGSPAFEPDETHDALLPLGIDMRAPLEWGGSLCTGLLDARGRLFALRSGTGTASSEYRLVADGVVALDPRRWETVIARGADGGPVQVSTATGGTVDLPVPAFGWTGRALVGPSPFGGGSEGVCLRAFDYGDHWVLVGMGGCTLPSPAGEVVAAAYGVHEYSAGLVSITADRRELVHTSERGTHTVIRAPAPIASAFASEALVVCWTDGGSLFMCDLRRGAIVRYVRPGDPS